MKKPENLANYLSLFLSLLALGTTIWLTYNNIKYFENQRYDALNQQLYEKKIAACLEILSSMDRFLNKIPSPLMLEDSTDIMKMKHKELLDIESIYNEYTNTKNKWRFVLPNELVVEISKLSGEATDLLLNYAKLDLHKSGIKSFYGKTLPKESTLINNNLHLTKSLREKRFAIENIMRGYIGTEELSDETIRLLENR